MSKMVECRAHGQSSVIWDNSGQTGWTTCPLCIATKRIIEMEDKIRKLEDQHKDTLDKEMTKIFTEQILKEIREGTVNDNDEKYIVFYEDWKNDYTLTQDSIPLPTLEEAERFSKNNNSASTIMKFVKRVVPEKMQE